MAVELRCPDCRAKLRLPVAPEAGTDVECPKCGTVFPAPEPDEIVTKSKKKPTRDADDDDADDKPQKSAKGSKDGDADGKKEKKGKKAKAKGAAVDPKVPKKRKAKKKETSNAMLFGVLGLGLLMLLIVGGSLTYLLTRTAKSVEMMYYLPEDCDSVSGINLGHAQKYPEFYKAIATSFGNQEFKAAGDALAKALGAADMDAVIDYIVFGSSFKSGEAVVIRTKTEIDGAALAKLPGAQAKTAEGKTYYVVDAFKGTAKLRVFAPTERLIVYCPNDKNPAQEAEFKKMLNGHADNLDKTVGVRAGAFGKRVTRGTFWSMTLYDGASKPPPPPATKSEGGAGGAGGAGGGAAANPNDDGKVQFAQMLSDTLSNAKGSGYKASIGSREVRFEWVVWCADSDRPANISKRFKDSELGKGDDGTPPRWWKEKTEGLGSKKIGGQLISNLGCGSSGDLFYARSAVDTIDLKDAIGTLSNQITGNTAGPGATMPGGPGGPAMPGGPPAGPPGGPPKMPRRRAWAHR